MRGQPAGNEPNHPYCIGLPKKLMEKVREVSYKTNVPKSHVVADALRLYFDGMKEAEERGERFAVISI